MYVAATMLDLGLSLVPRSTRKNPNTGPDLQLGPNGWIEAVAVTAGTGPDATVRPPDGVFSEVPEEKIKLRLISGLTEKKHKFDGYRKNGIVGPDDVCIVAINDALAYGLSSEWYLPRIVRAVMEVGAPVLVVDRQTREVIERTNEHQTVVTKQSGSKVGHGIFRDGTCNSVSACLYSMAGFHFDRVVLGCDFVIVHNQQASVPMRRALVQRGKEFWAEENELVGVDHGP